MKKYLNYIVLGIMGTLMVAGIVSAATILFPSGGGTGTSTAPTLGQLLVGNANGTYTLTATSSLGIISGGGTGFWTRLNNSGLYPATSTDQVLIGASATTSTHILNVVGSGDISGTLSIGTTSLSTGSTLDIETQDSNSNIVLGMYSTTTAIRDTFILTDNVTPTSNLQFRLNNSLVGNGNFAQIPLSGSLISNSGATGGMVIGALSGPLQFFSGLTNFSDWRGQLSNAGVWSFGNSSTSPTEIITATGVNVGNNSLSLSGNSSTDNFLNVTGTLPTSTTAVANGANFQIISGGSSSNAQNAETINFTAGYTGSSATVAANIANGVQGTGTGGWAGNAAAANFGLNSLVSSNTTGNNVAVGGFARNSSTLNIGVSGRATTGFNSPAVNVGVTGEATAATTSVAGFFGLFSGTPTLATSSALIADNGTSGGDLQIWQTAGVLKDVIDPGGNLSLGTSNPWAQFTLVSSSTSANVPIFDIASSSGASSSFFNVQSLGQVNVASGKLNISTTTSGFLAISPTGQVYSTAAPTISNTIANGLTGSTSFAPNSIITSDAAGASLIATTSQLTVGSLLSTTTAVSSFNGQLAMRSNGTVGTPSIVWPNNGGGASNAGLYASTNTVGISSAGITSAEFSGSTITIGSLNGGNNVSLVSRPASSGVLNRSGGNLTLESSAPTGNATGGNIIFQTPQATTTSGTANQSMTTRVVIDTNGNLGIGSSTPFSTISDDVASSTAGLPIGTPTGFSVRFLFDGIVHFAFDIYGRIMHRGGVGTLTACGTSATLDPGSNDEGGVIRVGTGVGLSSCTYNPKYAWSASLLTVCSVNQVSGSITGFESSTTASSLVITANSMAGFVYSYQCSAYGN